MNLWNRPFRKKHAQFSNCLPLGQVLAVLAEKIDLILEKTVLHMDQNLIQTTLPPSRINCILYVKFVNFLLRYFSRDGIGRENRPYFSQIASVSYPLPMKWQAGGLSEKRELLLVD